MITGPTGAGKTALALRLAEERGATIVSMDAMQVYRGMDVGTAKATAGERARVPHACVDLREPDEPFTAADFVREADAVRGPAILCGGTVFYLRAWWLGLVPVPAMDPTVRARFEALDDPWAALEQVDPVLAARLHPNDRVRVVRGLEVHALTGRPLSALHAGDPHARRDAEVIWIDRDDLYDVLDARVDAMMEAGYLAEVEGLLARGYGACKPMQSLGYRHLAAHLRGESSLDEAVRLTRRDTRHFARKQRGFLKSLGLSPHGSWKKA